MRQIYGGLLVSRRGFFRKARYASTVGTLVHSGLTAETAGYPFLTDTHHHIYASRFPPVPNALPPPGDAAVADYQRFRQQMGIIRHVLVQPSTYGVDNACLIDALQRFGPKTARGIAVVNTSVSQAE